MTVVAACFAILLAALLVVHRVVDGDRGASPVVADAAQPALVGDDLPEPNESADSVEHPGVEAPADTLPGGSARLRLLESLEAFVSSGSEEGLAEAVRLLDGPESALLTDDDIRRWRERIELARRVGLGRGVP